MQIPAPTGLIEVHLQRKFKRGRGVEITGLTPVEARMRYKNRHAAHGKRHEGQSVDPVGGSDQGFVTHAVQVYISALDAGILQSDDHRFSASLPAAGAGRASR